MCNGRFLCLCVCHRCIIVVNIGKGVCEAHCVATIYLLWYDLMMTSGPRRAAKLEDA